MIQVKAPVSSVLTCKGSVGMGSSSQDMVIVEWPVKSDPSMVMADMPVLGLRVMKAACPCEGETSEHKSKRLSESTKIPL
jgi:hypothetical protein